MVRQFADAEKTASAIIQQRNAGENPPFPEPEVLKAPLSSMQAQYRLHRENHIGRKTLTTNLSIWQRLIDFCGDITLDDVTSNDIFMFLTDRLKTAKDPWSQNYALGRAKNSLKDFFGLARTLNLMSVANPVLAMETTPRLNAEDAEARKNPRYPYGSDKLNKLFSSAWYDPNATHWTGGMRQDLGARYWAPIICLFHGLRVREVMQLHSHDISRNGDTLLMSIQLDLTGTESSDRPKRSLKNQSTKRTIPVHPTLIQLGFGQFVDAVKQRQAMAVPLFPSAIPDSDSKNPMWGRAYEQAFLRHAKINLKFGPGYANHSFRHTVEDRIRDAQALHGVWPPGLSQFYTGRKLPRDADKVFFRLQGSEIDYGRGFDPTHILKYVQLIDYPNVTLPPPFKTWLGERVS